MIKKLLMIINIVLIKNKKIMKDIIKLQQILDYSLINC